MRRIVIPLIIIVLAGCTSVKTHNSKLEQKYSPKQLKRDVDFVYNKLQKLHPELYWYISKEKLDYKFDSLKTTIKEPLTSLEFYHKISPVIACVGQGHIQVSPPVRRLTKEEKKKFGRRSKHPLSKFTYEYDGDKLYIIKNKSDYKDIKPGSEVISVNGIRTADIINKFKKDYASDGYNKTFFNRRFSWSFSRLFYTETGVYDSIMFKTNYRDTTLVTCLRALKKEVKENKDSIADAKIDSVKRDSVDMAKADTIKKKKPKRIFDNARKLRFIDKDSTIAFMRIKSFGTTGKRFYKKSFAAIDSAKANILIIDLRDNTGGKLSDVANLYSYLADTSFVFLDKSVVTKRTSMTHLGIFRNASPVGKVIHVILTPFRWGFGIGRYIKVDKENGKYYYAFKQSKLKEPKPNNFKGDVYVIINGGSFSASSIISSNLKGSGRAVFVGEETGGAYNGTVAGVMPQRKTPNAKINFSFGHVLIQPHYKTNKKGHGIYPDAYVTTSIQDKIDEKDSELDWIIEDIKKKRGVEEITLIEKEKKDKE
jgi:C-terminal processing protease CtpA/Prc